MSAFESGLDLESDHKAILVFPSENGTVKNLTAVQETQGQENPLEKMAIRSSIFAWNSWMKNLVSYSH